MIRSMALALLLAAAALPVGAQQQPAQPPGPPAGSVHTCTEPREQGCTRELNPVCATLRNGTRRTYSTGCTACADSNVVSHVPLRCP